MTKRLFLLILLVILCTVQVFSQTSAIKAFGKISRPEKWWTISHIFVALKAWHITKQVRVTVDSMKINNMLDGDSNGGKLDAFRHAYWMASLSSKIGSRKSYKLGVAHEKGNRLEFENNQLEDGLLPDSASCAMDLLNNQIGITIGSQNKLNLKIKILDEIKNGNLFILRKDKLGNYLDCNGKQIDLSLYKHQWNIPKCIVKSD